MNVVNLMVLVFGIDLSCRSTATRLKCNRIKILIGPALTYCGGGVPAVVERHSRQSMVEVYAGA